MLQRRRERGRERERELDLMAFNAHLYTPLAKIVPEKAKEWSRESPRKFERKDRSVLYKEKQ